MRFREGKGLAHAARPVGEQIHAWAWVPGHPRVDSAACPSPRPVWIPAGPGLVLGRIEMGSPDEEGAGPAARIAPAGPCTRTRTCTRVRAHTHVHAHTCTHMPTEHTHAHTCVHKCTHVHTRTCSARSPQPTLGPCRCSPAAEPWAAGRRAWPAVRGSTGHRNPDLRLQPVWLEARDAALTLLAFSLT